MIVHKLCCLYIDYIIDFTINIICNIFNCLRLFLVSNIILLGNPGIASQIPIKLFENKKQIKIDNCKEEV